MLDSHLETPPTSDHQSGGEDSERSELTSLTERLNKTRELTRVINMKLESTGHVSIISSRDPPTKAGRPSRAGTRGCLTIEIDDLFRPTII